MNNIEFSLRAPINCKIIAVIWLICAAAAYKLLPDQEWAWVGSLIISQVWLLWASIQESIIVRTIMTVKQQINDLKDIPELDDTDSTD